ncbi:MAG TPA: dihydrofolate reductase family protein [Anaerolineales bacterium]|nr:dihydrofolate reductase family protein [Anaerolineales bacterium]
MSRIVEFMNLTLDGVIQAPGRTDEDLRDGFKHGGWAAPYAAMSSNEAGESVPNFGALLLGRRTYEALYDDWPKQTGHPMTEMLNNMQKYVASRTLREPLPWINSTLLKGNVPDAVAELKAQQPKDVDLVIMGSGELIQTLMKHNLIDRYVLLIHPLVLGSGHRLFPESGPFATLQLISAKATPTGVVVATYEPAEPMAGKTS